MIFCEKCNYITAENRCPLCGNKKLRNVNNDDFCFFINLDTFHFTMFESALNEKKIDVIGIPYYPRAVAYGNAGRAQGRKVYLRYKDIGQAKEIYETLFGSDEET